MDKNGAPEEYAKTMDNLIAKTKNPQQTEKELLEDPDKVSDDEFFDSLLADDTTPRVCREIARSDFGRVLKSWKVLKKARRKSQSNDKEEKATYENARDLMIGSIMDGTLIIENDTRTGVRIIHNLTVPITGVKGDVVLDSLIYRKVPTLVDLRKMDEFEEKETIAKTQALAAAMSGRSTKELSNLSGADLDVIGALFVFFV